LLTAVPALLVAAAPAVAAGPVRVSFDIDRTQISPRLTAACGFPVEAHQAGKRNGLFFVDEQGNLTREILHDASFTNTWTNLNTGTSVTSTHPIVGHTRYAADGSSTVVVTGVEWHVNSPGDGIVVHDTGRRVWEFDADGNFVEEVFFAGKEDPLLPGLCQALGS
jgi:hypothetical protein